MNAPTAAWKKENYSPNDTKYPQPETDCTVIFWDLNKWAPPVSQVKAISLHLFPVCLSVHKHEAAAKRENFRQKNTNYILKVGEKEKEKENPCFLSASFPLFLKIREK